MEEFTQRYSPKDYKFIIMGDEYRYHCTIEMKDGRKYTSEFPHDGVSCNNPSIETLDDIFTSVCCQVLDEN